MCYCSFILVHYLKTNYPFSCLEMDQAVFLDRICSTRMILVRAVVVWNVHFTLFWSLFGLLFYVQMRNLLNNWMRLFTLIQLVNNKSQYRAS